MLRTLPLVCLLAAVGLAAEPKDPKVLVVPAEKTAVAKALVAKLTDEKQEVRTKAATELAKMGREALPALLDSRNGKPGDDLRTQLDELIPDARKKDFDARAELFLADKERTFDHALPGWNELKAAAKDTKESRLLFTDMLNDEACREMLLLAFDTTDEGRARFEMRWEAKFKEWQAASKAEFLAGIKTRPGPKADAPIQWMPAALVADLLFNRDYRSYYRQGVVKYFVDLTDEGKLAVDGKGRYGESVRSTAKYWVAQQRERFGLEDATSIARNMKFDKTVVLEREEKLFDLLVSTCQVNSSMGQLAATRDPKYITTIRRLFDNDKPYLVKQDLGNLPEIQLRDAALAVCVALSGQDPSEFGFTAQLKTKPTDDLRYSPSNYYFEANDKSTADAKRKAAFAKWAEWEKANPDKINAKRPEKK